MKSADLSGTVIAKASAYSLTDAEARRYEYRAGLETQVVHTVNDAGSKLVIRFWANENVSL